MMWMLGMGCKDKAFECEEPAAYSSTSAGFVETTEWDKSQRNGNSDFAVDYDGDGWTDRSFEKNDSADNFETGKDIPGCYVILEKAHSSM